MECSKNVKVSFFGHIGSKLEKKSEILCLPAEADKAYIWLCNFLKDKGIEGNFGILYNGRNMAYCKKDSDRINENDEINIMSIISGG